MVCPVVFFSFFCQVPKLHIHYHFLPDHSLTPSQAASFIGFSFLPGSYWGRAPCTSAVSVISSSPSTSSAAHFISRIFLLPPACSITRNKSLQQLIVSRFQLQSWNCCNAVIMGPASTAILSKSLFATSIENISRSKLNSWRLHRHIFLNFLLQSTSLGLSIDLQVLTRFYFYFRLDYALALL
uniref:Uncharacterized protein n=1 Tax=Micrurus lemniscatus lemniscatus TaxID=129467 RepID=A0A2D4IVA3_MICLE